MGLASQTSINEAQTNDVSLVSKLFGGRGRDMELT